MALLLFCCEVNKKLRVLLYTTIILTVFNAAATALFVHLILGASFSLLVLANFVVICYCESGIVKYQIKEMKISLIFSVVLFWLQVLATFLLFTFASQGKNKWSWSWVFTADDSLMFIPAFIQLIIVTLTGYSVFFIWQLWKQISFNGDLERSPPNLSIPSISWTVEEHQAQHNLGYIEEEAKEEQIGDLPSLRKASNLSNIEDPNTNEDSSYAGDNNAEMLKQFECPVCFNLMMPPLRIFQCSLGHNTCSACKSQGIEICPSCRNLVVGRAHNMENIARLLFGNVK
eukprot:GFUD01012629.1.p1 GENE.GFUD01012629.1~~GFUD01012629.1.p1  ORF type:complete len:304 (+),score=58.35 GFUD01012629.1:52-912(+)